MVVISQVSRTPAAEILRELSDSRYTVFDVLPAFFASRDPWVTLGRIL
jgi:acetyl-CoA carboxylase / biotin carboxylase 1